jgi:uncharacterized protein YdeI (YjbR/CyaY-like superfamily)
MPLPKPASFRVTLEPVGNDLHWIVARIPVDLVKLWPDWGSRRVRGEINGFAFCTTLFPGPKGSGRLSLLVNKKMQAGAKATAGAIVRIRLEPEIGPLNVPIPAELSAELKSSRPLLRWFQALSPSMQKGIAFFVNQAKGAETRQKRAEAMAEGLMLAMEGERELLPILRAAFQQQPQAERGWNAMTVKQRRNHLFGIFYARTVTARHKRTARAIEECLRVARRQGREPD